MKRVITLIAILLSATAASRAAASFKSVSDGVKPATEVLQKAIDECSAKGGGEVVVPPGKYLCKTIFLRDGVTLRLTRGATILGDKDLGAYAGQALVFGDGITGAGICGEGTIDGQADFNEFKAKGYGNNDKHRKYAVMFLKSKDISVRGITIRRSARWTFRLRECEKVRIDGIIINSMEYINCDGIDVEARDVVISNCIIDSDDDSICMKSDNPDFMVENITITNCVLASNSNAIKFGTSSRAGFRNVTISNCAIRPSYKSVRRNIWTEYRNIPEGTRACHSGIAIECVDGGLVENISISNITMEGIVSPIFMCINRRKGKVGTLRHVSVSNVNAIAEGVLPCIISGIPEGHLSDITLSNINIVRKSWDVTMDGPVPENYKSYPECRMYGHRNPACGLYARHVDGLNIDGLRVTTPAEEQRPKIVLEDVTLYKPVDN